MRGIQFVLEFAARDTMHGKSPRVAKSFDRWTVQRLNSHVNDVIAAKLLARAGKFVFV
jgi:hypothetical protein